MNLNPYNCTAPGHIFHGHERLLRKLENRLANGQSIALIGGRRCGKTSVLLELEKRLLDSDIMRPVCISIQAQGSVTSAILFEQLFNALTAELSDCEWQGAREGREYEDFIQQLHAAEPAIQKKLGRNWCLVWLVDELDNLIDKLPDDTFFQNLRHLLMDSAFKSHIRLVASGVKGLSGLISTGASPLNNLIHSYLSVLKPRHARSLIEQGFEYNLDVEVELLRLSGCHPFLLQGLLQELWLDCEGKAENIDRNSLKLAAKEFRNALANSVFKGWLINFTEVEHAIYQALLVAPDRQLSINTLELQLPAEMRGLIEDALQVLSFHCLIDDEDADEPILASRLFAEWYEKRLVQFAPRDNEAPITKLSTESETIPLYQPSIIVNIDNRNEQNITINYTQAITHLEELKSLIQQSSYLDENQKLRANHALVTAEIETRDAKKENRPVDSGKLKAGLKQAADIFKQAGGVADAVSKFKTSAESMMAALGQPLAELVNLF